MQTFKKLKRNVVSALCLHNSHLHKSSLFLSNMCRKTWKFTQLYAGYINYLALFEFIP